MLFGIIMWVFIVSFHQNVNAIVFLFYSIFAMQKQMSELEQSFFISEIPHDDSEFQSVKLWSTLIINYALFISLSLRVPQWNKKV